MAQHPVPNIGSESWENEGGSLRPVPRKEYPGITRLLSETFVVGGYSYTNLADAMAQAKRFEVLALPPEARPPF